MAASVLIGKRKSEQTPDWRPVLAGTEKGKNNTYFYEFKVYPAIIFEFPDTQLTQ